MGRNRTVWAPHPPTLTPSRRMFLTKLRKEFGQYGREDEREGADARVTLSGGRKVEGYVGTLAVQEDPSVEDSEGRKELRGKTHPLPRRLISLSLISFSDCSASRAW